MIIRCSLFMTLMAADSCAICLFPHQRPLLVWFGLFMLSIYRSADVLHWTVIPVTGQVNVSLYRHRLPTYTCLSPLGVRHAARPMFEGKQQTLYGD